VPRVDAVTVGVRRGVVLAFAALLSACAAPDVLVTSEQADRIRTDTAVEPPPTDEAPPPTEPTDPQPTDPDATDPDDPTETTEPTETVPADPVVTDRDAIDFGTNKPARPYDDFLLASLTDIEVWLTERFPQVYGEPYEPLEGKVYAAYPERPDDIPGCGEPRTTYDDVQLFVAFYCPPFPNGTGDFIVYDDGASDDSLLFNLAEQFGPATIGIVLAHEYGHAIQQRTGVLDEDLPTITTEQQADCIAGAWAGRARRGAAIGVPFSDTDVRAGLIAMIRVEDPVGIDQFAPGGHGSGFDRVGAFQVGFQEGLGRCAELIDDPLPLTPNQFQTETDFINQGNAPFGYDPDNAELFSFLIPDVNLMFDNDLDADFPSFEQLALVPTQSQNEVVCAEPIGRYSDGAILCAESGTVFLNEPEAIRLWEEIGDFSIGYLIGVIWAEAAQISNGSTLRGEQRALRNDCLVGAWVRNVTPNDIGELPQPRDEERNASISPGDLTEAITMAILIGDRSDSADVLGSAFEKIDAVRDGALGGFDACG